MSGRELKALFQAHAVGDQLAFRRAANVLIAEEESKSHVSLARDLRKLLAGTETVTFGGEVLELPTAPKDRDGEWPLADVRVPDRVLSDLVLKGATREQLDRLVIEYRRRRELIEAGVRPRHRLLFHGPPGTGKTTAAEAIAGELGLPFAVVRLDALITSLLGETASNLRRVMDFAASNAMVVLFDEFDSIGRDRADTNEHGELKRVVNALLQMIESYRGSSLLIAATNYDQLLDSALWRRFDDTVQFDHPTVAQIRELLRLRLAPLPTYRPTLDKVATLLKGCPQAAVEATVEEAARNRVLDGSKTITGAMLQAAASKMRRRRW